MFFQQSVTNTTAHRASSAEFAKWRDADEEPALLCHPFEATPVKYDNAESEQVVGPAWSEVVSGKIQQTSEVLGSLATERFEA